MSTDPKNNVENLFLNGRTINDISRYTDKGTPVIVSFMALVSNSSTSSGKV